MKRVNLSLASSLSTVGLLVAIGTILSVVAIGRDGSSPVATGDQGALAVDGDGDLGGTDVAAGSEPGPVSEGGTEATAGGGPTSRAKGTSGAQGSAVGSSTGTGTGAATASQCAAGKNGGATDVGITATSVKLAATVVLDGPGASFLAPVRTAMNAVTKKVNAAGGVCGRKLNLVTRNDSWDPTTGQQFIRNFVEGEKVFALAVVPSSEGLRAADRYIQEQKVPVVGTDGMLIHQYTNPWIWPVATSTVSTMHVMAKEGYERAKSKPQSASNVNEYGIVFDAKYHFGVEGAYAFNQAVKRLTGEDILGFDPSDPKGSLKGCTLRFCGIQPNLPSYSTTARDFNGECGMANSAHRTTNRPRCALVAVLLEPDTALTWFKAGYGGAPVVGFGGAQPLFNRNFAVGCGAQCGPMRVWTGYNPPIEGLAQAPAVAAYVNDMKRESSTIDVTNQFVQGGYQGMQLLVHALREVGPELTRDRLRARLDSMTFDSGLSQPLTWSAGDHFANRSARSFSMQYQGGFAGFKQETDFIVDPWVGQDGLE